MNKNVILATVFLLAGTLLTTAIVTTPAAYAEGKDHKEKKYRDGYDGERNYNSAEKRSKAQLNDCDDNKAFLALQACANLILPPRF